MALLPKIPWTDIDDSRVATDAPVSTDLWSDTVVDLNYLKAVLTDGAAAPQSISTKNVTANGTLNVTGTGLFGGKLTVSAGGADITGDVDMQDNVHIFGNLVVDGTFTFDTAEYLLAGFQSGR